MDHLSAEAVFLRLRDIAAQTFHVDREEINLESGPATMEQWDSLGHLRLMMAVETAFHTRFSVEQITAVKTLGQLREFLVAKKC